MRWSRDLRWHLHLQCTLSCPYSFFGTGLRCASFQLFLELLKGNLNLSPDFLLSSEHPAMEGVWMSQDAAGYRPPSVSPSICSGSDAQKWPRSSMLHVMEAQVSQPPDKALAVADSSAHFTLA